MRALSAMTIAVSIIALAPQVQAQSQYPAPTQVKPQVKTREQILRELTTPAKIPSAVRGITPYGSDGDADTPAAPKPMAPVKISTAVPIAAHAPAAAPAPAPAPAISVSDLTVNFKTGSAELSQQAIDQLNELGSALASAEMAQFRFRVEGHTDTVGSPASNALLSKQRADAVVDYLATKFNLPRDRMVAVGMGSSVLAVPTAAQVDEPRNRRVLVAKLAG